ncbi:MAG: DMT family transporter [Gemmatimonadales bacterium]|nr:DMT family transporter [Gemmatimonadales bacterium]
MPPALGLLLVTLFWAGNFTMSKLALRAIPVQPFTALRFALGATILVALLRPTRLPPRHLRWRLVGLGILGNTVYQVFFMNGLKRTTATNSALILAAVPAVVTAMVALLGIERVTRRQWAAVAVATIGVVCVVLGGGAGLGGGSRTGDLMTVVGVFCWAGYTAGVRTFAGEMGALEVTAWTMVTGAPGLVLLGVPEMAAVDWGAVPPLAWAGLLYSSLLSLVAAYFLWNRGVAALGASRTALYSCFTPLVATGIAMAVLGERPTLFHGAGAALILAGVLLSQRRPATA